MIGAAAAFALAFVVLAAVGLPDAVQLAAIASVQPGELPEAPVVGGRAPSFTASTPDGDVITLDDLRGAPVIINFWATWCDPCRVELPELQALYEARQADGLRILAVNNGESPARFIPWAEALDLTFDLIPDEDGALQLLYRVRGTPQTVLIDAAGVIRGVYYGPVTASALASTLDALP